MKNLLVVVAIVFVSTLGTRGQENTNSVSEVLSFEEYLGYVKQHHPLLKQANLQLSFGEANLLEARGGFDPKIEVDYGRKQFKSVEYYDLLNATFKIPTWYGVEFKANFEENTGQYLNPSLQVPEGGLYSAGVSFSLAQGLLMNERMAMLKKARFYIHQTKAQRDLMVNDLIFEASKAYLEWVEAYNEQVIYVDFTTNAQLRFQGVKRSVEEGDKAAIDATEAKITLQTRKLNLEAAKLKTKKAALKASNFLWVNDVPVEINEDIVPILPNDAILSSSLYLEGISSESQSSVNHPKIRSIDAKVKGLEVERSLKRNKLLPKLDFQYNFLSPEAEQLNTFNTENYKAGASFSMPLFLRKERGAVKLANLKLQDANFERSATGVSLQNKIKAVAIEIESLQQQNELIYEIVVDYQTMLAAEERKFELGESSLFLINSREQKLIEATLKANTLQIKFLDAHANLFNAMGVSEELGQ
ncbi:outer membrane protein TolC [Gillisia sp. Hel_I_86]|uniref:TolC family protein n=1 Tax=Gillisia sp. Hel_I_86 TaxID=1249981 RepID=UPI00119A8BEA|nr:TolC family protein [Gillisia sp. Hel_I_86]TVZ27942.1 outer membrane protein TolC [Gillisia sp. Hel_I_86]